MHTVSATEFSRNFSQMLNQVEQQGISISIVRNQRQIACLIPQLRMQTAAEAFGDLYRPLEGAVKDDWLLDIEQVNKTLKGNLPEKGSDPWL